MKQNIITQLSLGLVLVGSLAAQNPTPGNVAYQDYPYQIAYAAALGTGDASINITNTGATGANLPAGTASTTAGTIKSILVKLDDMIAEGQVVAIIEA
mgnify:CR=1 FL=1